MKLKKKNKGYTLIEFILVFAIFALMALGVYALATTVSASTTAKNESEKISLIIDDLERVASVHGGFDRIDSNAFNDITNNFVSSLELVGVSGTENDFNINYENVTGKVCTKFVSNLLVINERVSVRVNDTRLVHLSPLANIALACDELNRVSVIIDNDALASINDMSVVNANEPQGANSAPVRQYPGFVTSPLGTPIKIKSRTDETKDVSGRGFR